MYHNWLSLQSNELTRCLAPAVTGSRCRCCLGNRECTPLCSRPHRCRPPGAEPAEAHEPICRTWTPTPPARLPPPRCAPSACCASPACNDNQSPSYLDPETLIWDPWEVWTIWRLTLFRATNHCSCSNDISNFHQASYRISIKKIFWLALLSHICNCHKLLSFVIWKKNKNSKRN